MRPARDIFSSEVTIVDLGINLLPGSQYEFTVVSSPAGFHVLECLHVVPVASPWQVAQKLTEGLELPREIVECIQDG